MQRTMWILWPSFLVAAVAEMVFFAVFDPGELTLFGRSIELSRTAMYSIGFFMFWGLGAASSWLSMFLERDGEDRH